MNVTADTNVFVYALDQRDPVKFEAACAVREALASADQLLALQVVGELQNALRRSLGKPAAAACQDARNVMARFRTFPYDAACVDTALAHASAGRFSYWDALLLAACARAGIETLLSEDMQDGSMFSGVRVVNPFCATGISPAARELLNI